MASTASERLQKRRINELEQKLKKLQREIRAFKVEKKQVGHLRKQAIRAAQTEAEYHAVLEELDSDLFRKEQESLQQEQKKIPYKCKNLECVNAKGYKDSNNCIIIEAGSRIIVICQDCGKRYSVEANHHN